MEWNVMNIERYRQALAEILYNAIVEEEKTISAGMLLNMRDYKYRAGKLHALRDVVNMMDEAQSKLNKER